MKTFHREKSNLQALIHRSAALLAVLTGMLLLASPLAMAQTTVVWHRQAFGQTNICPIRGTTWYWLNNNNWSQAQISGDPCSEGASVVAQPSNWSTTNYPNGPSYEVFLGSAAGAPANLDVAVTLNSLTIQSDGGLNMQYGSSIFANAYVSLRYFSESVVAGYPGLSDEDVATALLCGGGCKSRPSSFRSEAPLKR
jgi:hypothetical protein